MKKVVIILICIFIASCGGGGGSDSLTRFYGGVYDLLGAKTFDSCGPGLPISQNYQLNVNQDDIVISVQVGNLNFSGIAIDSQDGFEVFSTTTNPEGCPVELRINTVNLSSDNATGSYEGTVNCPNGSSCQFRYDGNVVQ